jgi:parallel beta-helix repeat protein
MKRNAIALVLLLALVISAVAGILLLKAPLHKTITVPDDYLTIQEAIGNASAGDTVFVKNGIYHEFGIYIDKPLTIMGQNINETIVSGEYEKALYPRNVGRSIFYITASNVKISGFTLTASETAINSPGLEHLSGITITGNNISSGLGPQAAISVYGTDQLEITNNIFINNPSQTAIDFGSCSNVTVSSNVISGNALAIGSIGGQDVDIYDNVLDGNYFGISLADVSNVNIYRNTIMGNRSSTTDPFIYGIRYGVKFDVNCSDVIVKQNIIQGNDVGVYVDNFLFNGLGGKPQGVGNTVYSNNFLNNAQNANVEHEYSGNPPAGFMNGTDNVSWDNGKVGNYWSDYNGSGSYVIDENNVDHYPLNQQVDVSIAASSEIQLLPIVAIATISAYHIRRDPHSLLQETH